ncbi:uncharacterized protein MICPUCDRAFT_69390 [Micromonas pusilla CCMP1545]|uniref:Predicted protein n=1 Tax=Micromonas pusilla (strain CCMP1545) TaxID=564608 RepID=C1MTX0_MICPC|nr:uncharacterized protein MICPUCDRAFT_69390 [Micromonas pusilla CCMP1545]EEH56526.1 predicted protein [Micromonas pusilla CCMP1545]|eukprot:XP_003059394.1 predicted protein [Micromonas pusilla CCMP1545]
MCHVRSCRTSVRPVQSQHTQQARNRRLIVFHTPRTATTTARAASSSSIALHYSRAPVHIPSHRVASLPNQRLHRVRDVVGVFGEIRPDAPLVVAVPFNRRDGDGDAHQLQHPRREHAQNGPRRDVTEQQRRGHARGRERDLLHRVAHALVPLRRRSLDVVDVRDGELARERRHRRDDVVDRGELVAELRDEVARVVADGGVLRDEVARREERRRARADELQRPGEEKAEHREVHQRVDGDDAADVRRLPGDALDGGHHVLRVVQRALVVAVGDLGLDARDEERGRGGAGDGGDDDVADEDVDGAGRGFGFGFLLRRRGLGRRRRFLRRRRRWGGSLRRGRGGRRRGGGSLRRALGRLGGGGGGVLLSLGLLRRVRLRLRVRGSLRLRRVRRVSLRLRGRGGVRLRGFLLRLERGRGLRLGGGGGGFSVRGRRRRDGRGRRRRRRLFDRRRRRRRGGGLRRGRVRLRLGRVDDPSLLLDLLHRGSLPRVHGGAARAVRALGALLVKLGHLLRDRGVDVRGGELHDGRRGGRDRGEGDRRRRERRDDLRGDGGRRRGGGLVVRGRRRRRGARDDEFDALGVGTLVFRGVRARAAA